VERRRSVTTSEQAVFADVVRFYEREISARLERVRAMSPEGPLRIVDFFGVAQWPR
jgi:hypothetical protein